VKRTPYDTTLASRRRASRPNIPIPPKLTQPNLTESDLTYAIQYDAGNLTPSLTMPLLPTPTQDSEKSEDEQRDAIRHGTGKATPNVPTHIVSTPTQNPESSLEKPRDAKRHYSGIPTPSVATPMVPRRHKISTSVWYLYCHYFCDNIYVHIERTSRPMTYVKLKRAN
jgi:hypothetical protein